MKTAHRKSARAKQKRTKAYRPRHTADPRSIYQTMSRLQPFTGGEIATLSIPMWQAWAAMKNGRATETDFHTLAATINVALVCAETVQGDPDELCVSMIKRAQEALMIIHARYIRLAHWGVCYQSLEHIPLALEFYDQLLKNCTPLQMTQAMKEVINRANAGETIEY